MNILPFTFTLNGLLMIGMPIGLAIFLTRRWGLSWRFWFVGAATFILSQVGHIPFLYGLTALFQKNILPGPPAAWAGVFNAILLGLLAGLFEELSRYAMFRWWLKDARSWRKGVLAGAGHGGAEAIIFGVIALVALINFALMRNPAILASLPADQLEVVRNQVTSYWSTPWYLSLLGALERFFTIPIQICFAVIVIQTFTRRRSYWVWLAVLYHTIVDAAVVLVVPVVGIYWTEAVIGAFSAISVVLIFLLRQPEAMPLPEPQPAAPVPAPPKPVEETPENLDASRYRQG